LPYACFAIVAQRGVVVAAAPIARWTVGKPVEVALAFYRRKGASINEV
jgi:hypothetical protein